jgi:flagellar biosynthesis regulator FlbT
MSEELSILRTDEEANLATRRSDMASAFFKSIAGAAPLVGPFLSEAIGALIPNQKLDRLIAFAKVLNDRIKYLEDDTVQLKMKTEEFTDLLEDGLTQAAKAMTDERRSYIASLLTNSITNEQLSHVEEKKLLSLLGELNDAEILMLKSYSLRSDKRREFAQLHQDLFAPIHRSLGAPQSNIDKGALRDSYRARLVELGLLDLEYKRLAKGELPEFDERTGRIKATGYKVTSLGKLLLRSIGQAASKVEQTAQ